MIITEIKKQKANEKRYNIYIDGNFCFSASDEAVVKLALKEGKYIDEEALEDIIDQCEESTAYSYALNLIGVRDYTCEDIKQKLKTKQYSSHTISRVLKKLISYGFLNDEKYANKYIEYSVNIKKNGKNKIMYELQQKGIKNHEIELNEELEYNNALSLAEKKLRSIGDKKKPEDRIFRYLIQKGYDFDIIKKVVNTLLKNND